MRYLMSPLKRIDGMASKKGPIWRDHIVINIGNISPLEKELTIWRDDTLKINNMTGSHSNIGNISPLEKE